MAENVARGSLLGALAGASVGIAGLPSHLRDDLMHSQELIAEAEDFVKVFSSSSSDADGAGASAGVAADLLLTPPGSCS